MKKKTLVTVAVAITVILAFAAGLEAQTVKWRMATGRTPALTPYHEGDLHFGRLEDALTF
jgi:TRAP-type C4-dicarboxylate transport system substrate-binding protein